MEEGVGGEVQGSMKTHMNVDVNSVHVEKNGDRRIARELNLAQQTWVIVCYAVELASNIVSATHRLATNVFRTLLPQPQTLLIMEVEEPDTPDAQYPAVDILNQQVQAVQPPQNDEPQIPVENHPPRQEFERGFRNLDDVLQSGRDLRRPDVSFQFPIIIEDEIR